LPLQFLELLFFTLEAAAEVAKVAVQILLAVTAEEVLVVAAQEEHL
jgi:hypothetical protein